MQAVPYNKILNSVRLQIVQAVFYSVIVRYVCLHIVQAALCENEKT